MVRRTVTLPDDLDRRIREQAQKGESFSAAVSRILADGLDRPTPSYVGIADGPDEPIGQLAEEILQRIHADPDFRH